MNDICLLSIEQLARAFRVGDVSPVEVTEAALAHIEAIDPRVNSFVTVTPDLALKQARQAQDELAHGNDRGPLHGVPIGLKDLYATRGIRTTAHSRVRLDWIPDEDAACTSRLYDAGAVLLGKLAMHEFAWGAPGFDTPFPPARNPWDLSRSPGGSSSGSGAPLAARLCFGAMGSDTGGSIRSPAHLCNVTGLKNHVRSARMLSIAERIRLPSVIAAEAVLAAAVAPTLGQRTRGAECLIWVRETDVCNASC